MSPFSQKSKSIVPSTSKRVFELIPPSLPINGLSGAPGFSEGAVFSLLSLFTKELSPFVVHVTSEMRRQHALIKRTGSYVNKIPYSSVLCNLLMAQTDQINKVWQPYSMTQCYVNQYGADDIIGEARYQEPEFSAINKPFSSCLLPLYRNETTCKTIHSFIKKAFAFQLRFHSNQSQYCMRTRFETDAKGTWDMAQSFPCEILLKKKTKKRKQKKRKKKERKSVSNI